jgi:predicted amidophosphoribosyltransferase
MGLLRTQLKTWQDLLLPQQCIVCAYPGQMICRYCQSLWSRPAIKVSNAPYPVFAVRPYDRGAQRILTQVKEEGRFALQPTIVKAIVSSCAALLAETSQPVALVPIPSRRAALRKRGEDVLANMTQSAAITLRESGFDVIAMQALSHTRRVRDQRHLSADERRRNLDHALGPISPCAIGRRRAIVVDDIFTTGSTMREAWRALSEVAKIFGGACAASTSIGEAELDDR